MGMLSDEELAATVPAWRAEERMPLPTQLVSSDEYLPIAQTERQKKVAARLRELGDEHGRRNGLSRRRFFQTASGMATAFMAMNEIYGPLFGVTPAEAKSITFGEERAESL